MHGDVFIWGELVSVRNRPSGGSDHQPHGECSELYVGARVPEKGQNVRQPDGRKARREFEVIPGSVCPAGCVPERALIDTVQCKGHEIEQKGFTPLVRERKAENES